MKFINILLLLFPVAGSANAINPGTINSIFYNESYYGCFTSELNYSVKFYFTKKLFTQYFYVKYYNNRTNALLVNESYKLSDYVQSDNSMDYTLKTKGKLTSDGLKIVFSTGTATNQNEVVKTVVLYPTTNEIIYSYQYVNKAYTCTNKIFKIETDDVKYTESVRFENTIDYLTNDVFNAIDISEVSFTYEEGIDLVRKSTNKYLRILDIDNVYPYLSKDANSYINIPLECVQNGKDISLKYRDTFYYNPATLDMHSHSGTGLVATSKFYIPKGKLKTLENATFAIEMNEFGLSKFNIIIPLTFIKDRNYLGLCGESNHCIVGGIRE